MPFILTARMVCLPLGSCGLVLFVCTSVIVQSFEDSWDPISLNRLDLDGKCHHFNKNIYIFIYLFIYFHLISTNFLYSNRIATVCGVTSGVIFCCPCPIKRTPGLYRYELQVTHETSKIN